MTQLHNNDTSASLVLSPASWSAPAVGAGDSVSTQSRSRSLSRELPFGVVEAYAARLTQHYSTSNGGTGEHPMYSEYDWRLECDANDQVSCEYWTWVVSSIEQDRAMWPWDRDVTPAVLISRAAKLSVEQAPDKSWKITGLFATSIAHLTFGTELEAWQAAAYVVLTAPQVANGHPRGELEALPLTVLTHFVAVAVSDKEGAQDSTEASGAMRESERAANHWAQVAQAAGVAAQMTAPREWNLVNGPDVPTVSRDISHQSEVSAWRAAAIGLLEHLRQHLECPQEQWQAKSPGQHLELAKTFYADHRPPVPDFAFTQHYERSLKVLCQNIGWRVNRVRSSSGEVGQGWQLNRQGHYFTEADAWLAGADRIRRLVMKRASLSYLEWIALSLDDQISLGLSHAR